MKDNNSNKVFIPTILVILLLLGVVIVAILNNRSNTQNTSTTVTNTTQTTEYADNTVSGPVSGTVSTVEPIEIQISDMTFINGTITVNAGTSIRWINNDMLSHSIVANDGSFESVIIENGQSYEHTFNTVGEFMYHCGLHPEMTGKIIVE